MKRQRRKETVSARALIFRIILLAYILAVGFLCFSNFSGVQPDVPLVILGIPTDKIVHFCMFFPFPILAWYSIDRVPEGMAESIGKIISFAAYGCLFAGLTEIIQGLMPYRSEDINDFYADMIAICVSSLVILFTNPIKKHARS